MNCASCLSIDTTLRLQKWRHATNTTWAGQCSFDALVDAARRIVHSGLELSDKPAPRLHFRESFLKLAKEVEKVQKARHDAGHIADADLEGARYLRLDAEVEVLKAKRLAGVQQPR